MGEILNISQIESQFPSEWVLIGDPETDEMLRIRGGRVIAHSKNRDDVYRHAVSQRPKRFAMLYTGTIPKDAAIVL